MTGSDIQAILLETLRWLESVNRSYAIIGAHSLAFYNQSRATFDVDVLVAATADDLGVLRVSAEQHGFQVDQQWGDDNPMLRDVQLRLMRNGVPVDIMLPRDDQDLAALTRRQSHTVGNDQVWVLAPEDIILQKLKAGRPRDFDDCLPLFASLREQLNHEYLTSWATSLGVRDELDYLWSQSEPRES